MKRLVILLFITVILPVKAQKNLAATADLQQLTDDILALQDEEMNYEEILENLSLFLADPIDLNKVSQDQLRLLNILSEYQINELIHYRQEQGEFMSIYELQSIPGFDLNTIYKISPFIRIEDPSSAIGKPMLQRMFRENNNYFLMRYERTLEQKAGFNETLPADEHFTGSADKLYMRFRASRSGDFSTGFTMEKDAGEPVRWKPGKNQFGFDYNSFHLQLQNKGKWKNIIVGDFQVQAAQALVMGSSFGLGKGSETVTTAVKSSAGLLPHTSSAESGFLRGAGTTYQLSANWNITAFYSYAGRDASLLTDSTDYTSVSAFETTGLHRNGKEIEGKKNIKEQLAGGIVTYHSQKTNAGIIFQHNTFDRNVTKKRSVYNQFSFQGNSNYTGSVFLNRSFHNFLFFSEAAKNFTSGAAILVGAVGSLTDRLDISLVYRNYATGYHAPYSNAFGESSLPQNESGIYWGWKYRWRKKIQLSGYVDLFYFPWLRYRIYSPSQGHEWLLRFNYQPGRTTLFSIQLREENKIRNNSIESTIYHPLPGVKRNYVVHTQYRGSKDLRFRTRIQFSTFDFDQRTTRGITMIQDVQWDAGRISLTARHALFDTEDYDNRHYTYEDDVWLAFSVPAYADTGIRNYFIAEFKVTGHLSIWLRYSRTMYTKKDIIGSGLETITGKQKNDIKFQVMLKL